MACNQVLYHLGERHIEHAVIPWCETHGVAVTGYSPFGHDDFPAAQRRRPRARGDRAARAGRRRGRSRSPSSFVQPGVFTIPKAGTVAHVEENAGAGDLVLAADEIARIEAAFPLGRAQRGLPML